LTWRFPDFDLTEALAAFDAREKVNNDERIVHIYFARHMDRLRRPFGARLSQGVTEPGGQIERGVSIAY